MLGSLQNIFFEAVFDCKELNFIASAHAKERLNVYRQTIFLNLQHALNLTFPGVWALLGDESANTLAYAYYATHRYLPTNACLNDYGEDFPKFLKNIEQIKKFPYLPDYANFEWVKHLVEHEKHAKTVSINDFSILNPRYWEFVSFEFIDALAMFKSPYPIDVIHEMLNNPKSSSITLNAQSSYSIIVRPKYEILTYWIREDQWMFINLLWEGCSLFQSMEIVHSRYPAFNFSESLRFIFQHHMIKYIRRASPCVSIK